MSHQITIEISDDHHERLKALAARWAGSAWTIRIQIEAESCFVTGLMESERRVADADRWCRECGSPAPTHNKGCEAV